MSSCQYIFTLVEESKVNDSGPHVEIKISVSFKEESDFIFFRSLSSSLSSRLSTLLFLFSNAMLSIYRITEDLSKLNLIRAAMQYDQR